MRQHVASRNSRQFVMLPLVSLRSNVCGGTAEIPYRWHATTQIWVVLQVGWKFASSNPRHYPDLGFDNSVCHQYVIFVFLWWSIRHHIFVGKSVVALHNAGCFLRLEWDPCTYFRTETHKFINTVYNTSPRIHAIVWQIVTQSLISGLGWSVAGLGKRYGELRLRILFLGQTEALRGKN